LRSLYSPSKRGRQQEAIQIKSNRNNDGYLLQTGALFTAVLSGRVSRVGKVSKVSTCRLVGLGLSVKVRISVK